MSTSPAPDNHVPSHRELISKATELGAQFALSAANHDRTGEPPSAQFDALNAAGLLRLTIAQSSGGYGAGLAVARAVVSAIAQGDPSVALILAMHYAQHAAIARSATSGDSDWPAHLIRRLTDESVMGRSLINAAQVEPALGSPSHGGMPDTVARREGNQWRLSGHKIYVTGVPLLSWINVLARTDEDEPRLGHFLVPRDAVGLHIEETWDPIGMRASASHDVIFSDVAIPLADVVALKPARLGLQRDAQGIAWYFSLLGAVYDGAARAARDWLLDFLNQRRPSALGGAALASLPTVQEIVGQIEILLAANDWLMRSHAEAFDAGTAPDSLAGTLKHVVIDNAAQSVQLAIELAGNHGLARRNPLERHHRNVLCGRIHAPSNALLRGTAARAALSAAQQDFGNE
ncbi:acyl-CoA dehydrogenase [Caballeronia mineralivorans PML1(12)]|uniref:Acyl-CoA dehydrogenase n=1 Tax=Caballeronia mineralivorans PML1(12) TaxID=908627 RepID=A0A0J1CXH8_9BURK|nr:acyl-CoA dehydrogenase family protein [Caballeronia mineralivorans]KLU25280.1 acyl-CoA dehydrogenase [Caballeronia mineralivorans PML1(12)]